MSHCIMLDSNKNMYVTDCGNGIVVMFSMDGNFSEKIDCVMPQAIHIDQDCYIITTI